MKIQILSPGAAINTKWTHKLCWVLEARLKPDKRRPIPSKSSVNA